MLIAGGANRSPGDGRAGADAQDHRKRSPTHKVVPVLILLLSAAMYWSGILEFIDRGLMDSRFRWVQREPSGGLLVVEIDAHSLSELSTWPWPRAYHAQVLDNLFAAGARTVGVDIDFSSRSTGSADETLAGALERHRGQVILPAFVELQTAPGGIVMQRETLPDPMFRDRSRIGAVNVYPASDSLVREFPHGETIAGAAVPSMAEALARIDGDNERQFYLDYGIRIRDAPHVSYVDVLRRAFDPGIVRGKDVLIGATAVELGDHFAVPIYRALPGPLLQALAYESLVQHRALRRTGLLPSLAITALILVLLSVASRGWGWLKHLAALVAVFASLCALSLAAAMRFPVSLDVAMPAAAAFLYCTVGWLRQFEQQARALLQQRLSDTRRRALIQSVLEESFDGILVADATGMIEIANAAAARLLGQPIDQLIGMRAESLLPTAAISSDRLGERRLADEEFVIAPLAPVEIELRRPDDGVVILELAVSCSHVPICGRKGQEASEGFFTYTFRDITERRRTERELKAAMEEAVAASRAKSEFLASMSHELRTPLNAILGFSEIMREGVFGPLAVRYQSYAADINKSASHLESVISAILDLAKAETGAIAVERSSVKLTEVVDSVLRLVQEHSNAGGMVPSVKIDPYFADKAIVTDEAKLTQILLHLVTNAIKFSRPSGWVSIRARKLDEDFVISIRDNGVGIATEDIEQVMTPFGQVRSAYHASEGFGLGLPLSKKLAERLGGSLTLASQLGRGTIVTLKMPLINVDPAREPREGAAAPLTVGEPRGRCCASASADAWASASRPDTECPLPV